MFTWNNPYVLAVIIGLIAAAANYYTQKQKNPEANMVKSCGTSFFVATSLLMVFHYFTGNQNWGLLPQSGGVSKLNLNDLKIQPGLPNF
jgi:hypothetical protein